MEHEERVQDTGTAGRARWRDNPNSTLFSPNNIAQAAALWLTLGRPFAAKVVGGSLEKPSLTLHRSARTTTGHHVRAWCGRSHWKVQNRSYLNLNSYVPSPRLLQLQPRQRRATRSSPGDRGKDAHGRDRSSHRSTCRWVARRRLAALDA